MALPFVFVLVFAALSSSACEPSSLGRTRAWQSPASATPSEPPASSPAPLTPNAVLTMSKVTVTVVSYPGPPARYEYVARFELKETGGRSGATIRLVLTSVGEGQAESTGSDCWGEAMRVPPGGTMVDFDSGWKDLSYCAPYAWSLKEAETFTVSVHFIDDEGRHGSSQRQGWLPGSGRV